MPVGQQADAPISARRYKGSATVFINTDTILHTARPTVQVTTLASLVVPAVYTSLDFELWRITLLWHITEMQAVAADIPIGQALDDADDAGGDDDEDED
jgi:hypothetical protein